MKKIRYRAGAIMMAALLFFCTLFNTAQPVQASVGSQFAIWCISQVFGWALNEGLDAVTESLGWTDADINTDADGNVIISPEQIEELKKAYEDNVLATNGAFTYESQASDTYFNKTATFSSDYGDLWLTNNPVPQSNNIVEPMWYSKPYSHNDPHIELLNEDVFWVVEGTTLSNPAVCFFDSNLNQKSNVVENWYFDFNGDSEYGQGWALWNTDGGTSSASCYFGPPHICFETVADLQAYLGLPDEEKPFLIPGTNTVSSNTITVYNPEDNSVTETNEYTYNEGDTLVFTPEGNLYLNYTDIDNDGIPDDKDDDVVGDEDTDSTVQIMRTGTITYTGTGTYGKANPVTVTFEHQPIHVWGKCDDDGDYTIEFDFGFGDSTFLRYAGIGVNSGNANPRQNFITWSEDGLSCSWYANGTASGQCNTKNAFYTITYTYYENIQFADGSAGSGTVDLKKTESLLDSINNTLDDILKWIKKIYNQVVLGNVIEVADIIIDELNNLGDDAVGLVKSVADLFTGILQDAFPLCFIWDIFLVLDMFVVEPAEPIFTLSLDFSSLGLPGEPIELAIDLTPYESLFAMFRVFQILFFLAGLMNLTFDWIVDKGDKV